MYVNDFSCFNYEKIRSSWHFEQFIFTPQPVHSSKAGEECPRCFLVCSWNPWKYNVELMFSSSEWKSDQNFANLHFITFEKMPPIQENCTFLPLLNMERYESLFTSMYRLWWPGCVQRNKDLCENIFGEETSWCHLIVLESKTSAAADSTGDVSNWWANSCLECDSSHLENVKVVMVSIVEF